VVQTGRGRALQALVTHKERCIALGRLGILLQDFVSNFVPKDVLPKRGYKFFSIALARD